MTTRLLSLMLAAAATSAVGESTHAPEAPVGVERVASMTVLVSNQDEALRWYTEALGFEKRADESGTLPGFRWLTVGPRDQPEFEVVLLQADATNRDRVGKATTTVLATKDCRSAVAELKARGVEFDGEAREMPWGIAADLVDLYGNPYHLLQKPGR